MVETRCGVGLCKRSMFFQRFGNLKTYSGIMGFVVLSITACYSYMYSVQSTTQTVFSFNATDVGIWFAMFEIGSVIANVFGSFFLSKKHIPRILGTGVLLMTVGCFIHGIPNFTVSYEDKIKSTADGANQTAELLNKTLCHQAGTTANDTAIPDSPTDGSSNSSIVLAMYCIAGFMMGTGYAPLWSLGLVYIDNNVEEEHGSTAYIAVLLGTYTIGPVLGYGAGSVFLSKYVTLKETYLTPDDAQWIGAWWIGYLAFGSLLAVFIIPLFMFPKQLAAAVQARSMRPSTVALVNELGEQQLDGFPDQLGEDIAEDLKRAAEEANAAAKKAAKGASAKDFLPTMKNLILNPLWLVETLCACGCSQFLSGCIGFLPKYYEEQFYVSSSRANLLSGIPGPFLSVFSICAGGYFAYKKKYTLQQDARLVFITTCLAMLLLLPTQFMQCKLYPVQLAPVNYSQVIPDCDCDPNAYDPICGGGVAYRSPCLVGCKGYDDTADNLIYTGCLNGTMNMTSGRCVEEGCLSPYFFTVCTTLSMAVLTFSSSAGLNLIMRSVTEEEKSLALGVQSSVNSLLAWIPAPILFGAVIDTTCKIWEHPGGTADDPSFQGYCMEYDGDAYRFKFLTLSIGMLIIATAFAGLGWFCSRQARYLKTEFKSTCIDKHHDVNLNKIQAMTVI